MISRPPLQSAWLSVAVLATIAMLVIPMPTAVLDALLALDIMGAAVILVAALSIRNPLELAAFPALMLVATLFRLSLDVSATRLILTQGDQAGGVGTVIPAFGDFVMRGNAIVGLLVFAILIIVQLVVVANGAQRVAEVAARFTLDAMPGKQMAIDADLHAGLIDAGAARARRHAVQAEADFYGAMDGAGKFVRGDAIAALIIVIVNVVAGIAIGVLGKHLDFASAAQTYALLSIGNALATTIPAFLLSTSMGVMVTRAGSDEGLGSDILRQLLSQPSALRTVGAAMLLLAVVPGLPHLAFGALGVCGFAGGHAAVLADRRRQIARFNEESKRRQALARKPESAVALIGVDGLAVDVGESLLPLLDEPAGSVLLQRIASMRRTLAMELGVVLPGVQVRDDPRLPTRGYAIRVRDRVVVSGQLHADRPLAIGEAAAISQLPGEAAVDPVTETPARWLAAESAPRALDHNVIFIDPIGVLASTLARAARANAAALLGRQETQVLLDHLRQTHPAAVKGVVPEIASLGLVQRVAQHLLRESVSIRDLAAILEVIADEAENTKDPVAIGEAARSRLAPAICAQVSDRGGVIRAFVLGTKCEAALAAATVVSEKGALLALDARSTLALRAALVRMGRDRSERAVVVCSQSLRVPIARFAELSEANIAVVGLAEVAPGYIVEAVETIELEIEPDINEEPTRSNGKPAARSAVRANQARS